MCASSPAASLLPNNSGPRDGLFDLCFAPSCESAILVEWHLHWVYASATMHVSTHSLRCVVLTLPSFPLPLPSHPPPPLSMSSCRSSISARFFPRLSFLYFLLFHLYFFSFTYGKACGRFTGNSRACVLSLSRSPPHPSSTVLVQSQSLGGIPPPLIHVSLTEECLSTFTLNVGLKRGISPPYSRTICVPMLSLGCQFLSHC